MSVRAIAATVAALSLSGCAFSLKSDTATQRSYWLEPAVLSGSEGAAPGGALSVMVEAAPGLDTASLLVLSPEQQLMPIAGSSWVGPAPRVIESTLVQSLESGGHYDQVYADGVRGPKTDVLRVDIRRFFAESTAAGGPPRRVHLTAALRLQRSAGSPRCREVDVTENVPAERVSAVVAAFQQVLDRLAQAAGALVAADSSDAACGPG